MQLELNALRDLVAENLNDVPDGPLGVAVSGGGDSMALLDLLRKIGRWELRVVTVDHRLRDVADEIALVADYCAALGLSHDVVTWTGWDKTGNLQNAARAARRDLIQRWAGAKGIQTVAFGHTETDQAETVLMRLARGSGVDGLAGIAPVTIWQDVAFYRPLLSVGRDMLRAYLQKEGIAWADDPSNDDPQFDRVKMRQALPELAALGFTQTRLAQTAAHFARARDALDYALKPAVEHLRQTEAGSVDLPCDLLAELPTELQTRLITGVMAWINGANYRPRYASVLSLRDAALKGGKETLGGVVITSDSENITFYREFAAIDPRPVKGLFDGRWRVSPKIGAPDAVRPLGEDGLRACPNWRDMGLKRDILLATPSVWRDGNLRSSVIVDMLGPFRFELESSVHEFLTTRAAC